MKSNICSKCGVDLNTEQPFCPNCGQKNDDQSDSYIDLTNEFRDIELQTNTYNSNYNNAQQVNANYGNYSYLQNSNQANLYNGGYAQALPQKKKVNPFIIILAAVFAVAIIIVATGSKTSTRSKDTGVETEKSKNNTSGLVTSKLSKEESDIIGTWTLYATSIR